MIDVREKDCNFCFLGLEFLFFFPPRTEASLLVDCLFVVVWNSAAAYVKKIFCFLLLGLSQRIDRLQHICCCCKGHVLVWEQIGIIICFFVNGSYAPPDCRSENGLD